MLQEPTETTEAEVNIIGGSFQDPGMDPLAYVLLTLVGTAVVLLLGSWLTRDRGPRRARRPPTSARAGPRPAARA